jgi:plastocyanin/uncharacterized membrane protein
LLRWGDFFLRLKQPLTNFRAAVYAIPVMSRLAVSSIVLIAAWAGDGSSTSSHFIRWVGHFHPAMTVFPIAMILGAAIAELLRIFGAGAWLDGGSRWCMIVGGIGGLMTAPLGWAFALQHGESRLLEIHRWLGTCAGGGALILLILSEVARRKGGGALTLFRAVLFLAVPLVVATGFFGGAMVYGVHEYDWRAAAPEKSDQGQSDESHGTPATSQATPATSQAAGSSDRVAVEMTDDDTFKPDKITIKVGATVHWQNVSKDTHTVTDDVKMALDSNEVSMPAGAAPFNSGDIKPGGSFEQRFTLAGTYKYICRPHEAMDMKGQIVVQP